MRSDYKSARAGLGAALHQAGVAQKAQERVAPRHPVTLVKGVNHIQEKTAKSTNQQINKSTNALFGFQDFMCLISYIIYIL